MPDSTNGKKPVETKEKTPFPDHDLDKIVELLDEAIIYLNKARNKMEAREVRDLENK